ncbi:MAG: hypothetical protein E6G34_03620 [Actinobacteria bacterium]|nr:MAG: hypothetical protein E6G34_03620 [Actinomycetota bacterium]
MSASEHSFRQRPRVGDRAAPGARNGEGQPASRLHLLESVVLLLAALLLGVATVNDVVRQTHINHRLVADLRTWRAYTGHDYRRLSVSQDFRHHTKREVVCGNTSPGAPKARVQVCLLITGPVSHARRTVSGGWYLPPRREDLRGYRYACFGHALAERRCPR